MNRLTCLLLTALIVLISGTWCSGKTSEETNELLTNHPSRLNSAPAAYTGTVVETMNTSGYTYVRIDTGKEKIWVAAPEFQVKVGDKVKAPQGAPMKNYRSKTLNRTFGMVYFVGKIGVLEKEQAAGLASSDHPNLNSGSKGSQQVPSVVDFSGITRPDGGKTVAEIHNEKKDLSGKKIIVRGKVVKFNSKIMGTNWAHIQDGTGAEGTNDLTVTTSANVKAGDTVLVRGVVAVDKDFGSGYKYKVIIEDAMITVE